MVLTRAPSQVSALGRSQPGNPQAAPILTPTCKIRQVDSFSFPRRQAPPSALLKETWYPDGNKDQTSRTSAHVDSWSREIYVTSELGSPISTPTKSAAEVGPPMPPPPVYIWLVILCCCCLSQRAKCYSPFSDF